jgi:hypothetical protein
VPIPADQVRQRKHWKETREKSWQGYSKDQILVVEKILRALKEEYPGIREFVGHDMVNLVNRLDPGPLFPLGELRKAILGDPQNPQIRFTTQPDCKVYVNIDGRPPHREDHPQHGLLPKNKKVRIREGEIYEHWTKVLVKDESVPGLNNKEGWVRANSLKADGDRHRTTSDQILYQVIPATPPRFPPLFVRTLPGGKQVRKLTESLNQEWILVTPVLDEIEVQVNQEDHVHDLDFDLDGDGIKHDLLVSPDMQDFFFLEGWVRKEKLIEP